MIARTVLSKMNCICVFSMNVITVLMKVTPPNQIANELNQQQLVPSMKVTILPIIVFL